MAGPNIATASIRMIPDFSGFGGAVRFGMSAILRDGSARAVAALGAIGLSMAGVAAGAARMFSEIEMDFAKIVGLAGVAKETTEAWGESLLRISSDTARAPNELSNALYFIASAGLRGASAMDILETSARAATAGLGDTAVIADLLTSAINAYGEENLSARDAADVLVAAVREGKVEADALAGVLGRVVPLTSELGIEFDQTAAAVAAMSRVGLDAAESVTAFRGILTSFLKPSAQAVKVMAQYGLSMADIREALATGDTNLIDVLLLLKNTFGDNEEALAKIFPRVRGLVGFLSLVGENADEVREVFSKTADATGSLDYAFEQVAGTDTFKFQQALNDIKVIMVDLGRDVLPRLADLLESVGPGIVNVLVPALEKGTTFIIDFANGLKIVIEAFQDWPVAAQIAVAGLVGAFAALKLIKFTAAHPLVAGLALISTVIARLGADARESEQAVQNLFSSMKSGLTPLEAVIEMLAEDSRLGRVKAILDGMGISMGQFVQALVDTTRNGNDFKGFMDDLGGFNIDDLGLADWWLLGEVFGDLNTEVSAAIELQKVYERETMRAGWTAAQWAQEVAAGDVALSSLTPAMQAAVREELALNAVRTDGVEVTDERIIGEEGLRDAILATANAELEAASPALQLLSARRSRDEAKTEFEKTLTDPKATQADREAALANYLELQLRVNAAAADFALSGEDALAVLEGTAEFLGVENHPAFLQLISDLGGAIQATTNLGTAAMPIGYYLKNGILTPLESLDGEIADALVGETMAGLAQARRLLLISSPSRLFADKLGKPLAQGVAEGIRSQARVVFDALNETIPRTTRDLPGGGFAAAGSGGGTVLVMEKGAVTVPVEFPIDKRDQDRIARSMDTAIKRVTKQEARWRHQ